MSDQNNKGSTSKFPRGIILFAFTILLLGAISVVWFRNFSFEKWAQPTQENNNLVQELGEISTKFPGEVAAKTIPTHEAPPSPTPLSTSLPEQTPIPLPAFDNPPLSQFVAEADSWKADFIRFDPENTGIFQFPNNSFTHPLALEIHGELAYLLDGGRVLAIDLTNQKPPTTILAPGDIINSVLVLEPLDLTLTANALLVLDRAGDVYRYDLGSSSWHLDRYDRPVEASSGHYFVAVDGIEGVNESVDQRALLETNYMFTMLYGGDSTPLWNLAEGRSVDLSIHGEDVYVLQRALHETKGFLTKYNQTRLIPSFDPQIEIDRPLQVVATENAVYVLDQGGSRLHALNLDDGKLLRVYQLPQTEPASAFAIDADEKIVLAARNRLYFHEKPDQLQIILANPSGNDAQPHDPGFLTSLVDYSVPIGGSNITFRDFQMPGAPRHYRLGVHHGIDFYWQPGTKVLAAADGVIIRADVDYIPPTALQLSYWWAESQERGYTSKETLDKYLGRQVWIEHEGGLISKYGHLRSISPGISEGVLVKQGQEIGEVGNSGSPSSLESEKADAHLHFELWIGEHYLGQFLRPIEAREWVEKIFSN